MMRILLIILFICLPVISFAAGDAVPMTSDWDGDSVARLIRMLAGYFQIVDVTTSLNVHGTSLSNIIRATETIDATELSGEILNITSEAKIESGILNTAHVKILHVTLEATIESAVLGTAEIQIWTVTEIARILGSAWIDNATLDKVNARILCITEIARIPGPAWIKDVTSNSLNARILNITEEARISGPTLIEDVTSRSTNTEIAYVTNKVGVGTGDALVRLHVKSDSNNTTLFGDYAQIGLLLENAGTTNNNYIMMDFWDGSNHLAAIGTQITSHATKNADMVFATKNGDAAITEKMRLYGNGNLEVTGNIYAASFIDGTRSYPGTPQEALNDVLAVRADEDGNIDHSSLRHARVKRSAIKRSFEIRDKETNELLGIELGEYIPSIKNKVDTRFASLAKKYGRKTNKIKVITQSKVVVKDLRDIGMSTSRNTMSQQYLYEKILALEKRIKELEKRR